MNEFRLYGHLAESWTSTLLAGLHRQQRLGLFCDAKLQGADGVVVTLHSCILAAASPTFRGPLNSSPLSMCDIPTGASELTLRCLVDFLYTGRIQSNGCDTADVVHLAAQLGVDSKELVQLCTKGRKTLAFSSFPRAIADEGQMGKTTDGFAIESALQVKQEPCEHQLDELTVIPEHLPQALSSEQPDLLLSQHAAPVNPSSVPEVKILADNHLTQPLQCECSETLMFQPVLCADTDTRTPQSMHRGAGKPLLSPNKAKNSKDRNTGEKLATENFNVFTQNEELQLSFSAAPQTKQEEDTLPVHEEDKSEVVAKTDTNLRERSVCTNNLPFLCDICGKSFKTRGGLQPHLATHHQAAFHCSTCGKCFKYKRNLREHMQMHDPANQCMCDECGQVFKDRRSLRWHKDSHMTPKYHCSTCGKSFVKVSNLKTHEVTHQKKMRKCSVCGKRFHHQFEVNSHERACHNSEKPFRCSFCKSAFKRRDHLKAHERLHTASKPYRCRPCQLTFAQYNSLSYHLKRTHNITGKLSELPGVVGREFVGTLHEDE